jgi:hypothetical protein
MGLFFYSPPKQQDTGRQEKIPKPDLVNSKSDLVSSKFSLYFPPPQHPASYSPASSPACGRYLPNEADLSQKLRNFAPILTKEKSLPEI